MRIRRKGGKELPRLPPSAFSPPNSGTSDRFPLPPSPSTIHPEQVVDAYVVAPDGDLTQWKTETGQALGGKVKGVVLSLKGKGPSEIEGALKEISSEASGVPILSTIVPLQLGDAFIVPDYIASATSSSKPRIAVSMVFEKADANIKQALAWTMSRGLVANIDVESDVRATEGTWESLEELISSADEPSMTPIDGPSKSTKGKIVISNILPPLDDLSLPIVKLLTHPVYRNYQSRTASLSLYSHVYINFLPTAWGNPVPSPAEEDRKEWNEWKRRLKMYIGPVIEAFGYQRVIFGSSPATSQPVVSNAGHWYALARECLAELGIEQEGIDAVFSGNATLVYS